MTEDLLIIGAGGSSREIAAAVAEINRCEPRWKVVGFLDDDPAKAGSVVDGVPVLGPIAGLTEYPAARCVVGIANHRDASLRRRVTAALAVSRERLATIRHPSASIAESARVGPGSAVLQNVVITTGSVLGTHVLVCQGSLIAHDVAIEDCVTIAPGAVLSGGVRIEESAYVGTGAVIGPGVVVGRGCLVGIGAVVTADVPPGSTVFGNPARAINSAATGLRRWA